MSRLALLRHAPTAWNEQRRLQGRADIALSGPGRAALAGRRIPAALAAAHCHVSPLKRARETADLLGLANAGRTFSIEARLIETDWHLLRCYTPRDLASSSSPGLWVAGDD